MSGSGSGSMCWVHIAIQKLPSSSSNALKTGIQRQEHNQTESEVVYWLRCSRWYCDDEYIGESVRTFGERFKEFSRHLHLSMNTSLAQTIAHKWRTSA